MWETGFCGFAIGGWFWIVPLTFMTLCFAMMFVGRKKGATMGCTAMSHGDRVETRRHTDGPVEDIAKHRHAVGEIGREEVQHAISDLTKK